LRAFLVTALAALVALGLAPAAFADGASFGLRPVTETTGVPASSSYFVLNGQPGQTITQQVRVFNAGTATGTAALYPVDATTGQTSGTVFLSGTAPKRGVGSWISLSARKLTLAAGASRIVSFVVHVPRTARPGQWVGGITAENLALQKSTGQTGNSSALRINIRSLTINAVQVNVRGAMTSRMQIGDVKAGGVNSYQQLLIGLRNTGTVMLKPKLSVSVYSRNGRRLHTNSAQLDTFLPGTAIAYPVLVRGKALGPGTYQARITVTYGQGRVVRAVRQFTVTSAQIAQAFPSLKPTKPPAPTPSRSTIPPSPVARPATPAAPATSPTIPPGEVASPTGIRTTLPPHAFAPYSNPATPPTPAPAPSPSAAPKPQPQAPTTRPARPAPPPIAVEVAAPTPWQRNPLKLGLVAFMILSSLLAIAVVGRMVFETLLRR
jgi:hypothetical protein